MKPLGIGILGLGTVGRGLLQILREQATLLRSRSGLEMQVRHVFDRSWQKKLEILGDTPASDNLEEVLRHPDIDVVVELIGGIEPAYDYVREALRRGKHVVTANKALLARHGNELFQLAYEQKLNIGFEAAVAGALPVIRNMRRSFITDNVSTIVGILNGTSNFILTRMMDDDMDYDEALALAQERGFAEADPTFDVGGYDAAQKLAILAALAFDTSISEDAVVVEGIDRIRHIDLDFAAGLRRVVRPLSIAKRDPDGRISLRVHPGMIPGDHPLATIDEERNAVLMETSNSGPSLIMGLGAGARPTAAAVISDLVFLGGCHPEHSQIWLSGSEPPQLVTEYEYRFYLRFETEDRPGVLAEIAGILAKEDISIAQVHQNEAAEPANIVVVTHSADEAALFRALDTINDLSSVLAPATFIRMKEDFQEDFEEDWSP